MKLQMPEQGIVSAFLFTHICNYHKKISVFKLEKIVIFKSLPQK